MVGKELGKNTHVNTTREKLLNKRPGWNKQTRCFFIDLQIIELDQIIKERRNKHSVKYND